MSEKQFRLKQLFSLLLIFLVSGCASYQDNLMDPPGKTPQKKTDYSVEVGVTFNVDGNIRVQRDEKKWEKSIANQFKKSKFFKEAGTNIQEPDLNIDAVVNKVSRTSEHAAMQRAKVMIFSLGLIPIPNPYNFKMTAEIFERGTGKIGTIRLEEGMTTWVGWFIIPMRISGKGPSKVRSNIRKEMAKKLVHESINRISFSQTDK